MADDDVDEMLDPDPSAGPPVGRRVVQRCSYCDQPGHRVTTCPERRKLARAERLIQIEDWARRRAAR